MPGLPSEIAVVVAELQHRIDALPPGLSHRRIFIQTYQRTMTAVGAEVARAGFEDPDWVTRWDVVFAEFFLRAHDRDQAGPEDAAGAVPRPWRLAFGANDELPTLIHLLLGMNAHINFDLPQAILAVIDENDFDDPVLLDRRRRDHQRIDRIMASRVTAEDHAIGDARSVLDRILTPANRMSSRRMLREARGKVWLNAAQLHQARLSGVESYTARVAELEVLAAAKITDLVRPGQVLLRLAASGFGILLPPLS